jgi:nucleoside-diphosphate kinase
MPLAYSFSLAKPDAVRRKLVGRIITRFEERGLDLVDIKYHWPDEKLIRQMYLDKATEEFFPELLAFMTSGPSVAMVWQGEDAIEKARQVIGNKLPLDSDAGTIRGSMAEDRIRSLVHGSRSPEEAWAEMLLWFPERWSGEPVPAEERPPADAPKAVPPKIMQPWWEPEEALP